MITAGVDIGSVATKVVLLADGKDVLAREIRPSGVTADTAAEEAFEKALAKAGLDEKGVARVVATGYGRRRIDFSDRAVTEISACAAGALWGEESTGRLLAVDLGGQDTKAILLGPAGVEDFVMNDKCAAGTGRFLEVMAHALEVTVDDLGSLSGQARHPQRINSTCAVFAESEVISLLSHGAKVEDIVAGIHNAIAERIAAMAYGFGEVEKIVFCGGGAKNAGVQKALEQVFDAPVAVPDHPQFLNAVGAALIALEAA